MIVLKRQIRSASKALIFPNSTTFYTPWPATRLYFFPQTTCDQTGLQPVLSDTNEGKASQQKMEFISVLKSV